MCGILHDACPARSVGEGERVTMKPYGWTGKVLWVDLTSRKIKTVPTSDFEPEKYLGGVGLNSKIFWEMGCPRVEALDPQSPLLISVGPVTGTAGPFSRAEICGIAPQAYPQEIYAYSGVGGKIATEIKYAGYDALVIVGKSDQPVTLSILDDQVKLNDAKSLWGLDTFQTQKTLMANQAKAAVLTIGPAGENLCRVAIILNETASAAGQGGYGAVMGSKNLKAIVVKGSGSMKVARPDVLMKLQQGRMEDREWLSGAAQSWGRYPLTGGQIAAKDAELNISNVSGDATAAPINVWAFTTFRASARAPRCAWKPGTDGSAAAVPKGTGRAISSPRNWGSITMSYWVLCPGCLPCVGGWTRKALGVTSIPIIDHSIQTNSADKMSTISSWSNCSMAWPAAKAFFPRASGRAAEKMGPAAKAAFDANYPARGYHKPSYRKRRLGLALGHGYPRPLFFLP